MFEIGDIIVCINNKIDYSRNDGRVLGCLTIGKKYNIISTRHDGQDAYYEILNDSNYFELYYEYRFVSLLEYRNQKLKKICLKLDK